LGKNDDKKIDSQICKGEILTTIATQGKSLSPLGLKLTALAFLDASQRVWKDEVLPAYCEMSEMLSIPESTLRNWWRNRTEIYKQADSQVAELPRAMAIRYAGLALMVMDELERRLFDKGIREKLSARDLVDMSKELTSKYRLLSGGSTSHVLHGGSVQIVPPVASVWEKKKPD